MDEKKLLKLQKLLETANEDFLTLEQAKNLFAALQSSVQEVKTTLEAEVAKGNADTMSMCKKMLADISKAEKDLKKSVEKRDMTLFNKLSTDFSREIESVKRMIPVIPDPVLFDPTELQNQIDVLMAYETPEPKPVQANEVRDLLETLKDEERLDASAIKNLPEATKTVVEGMNKALALYMLIDMDLAGIAVGQSIKWDGVRWIPYTPAAGTGTAVYNEVAGGSGTTFTLAHTPTSDAVVRVYARGQRILSPGGYSISGATITTVDSWSATDITVDYEY